MHILLVEDDDLLGDGIEQTLQQQNHHITWAKDGEQAATHLKNQKFDVVILDLNLPKRSGMDLLSDLRQSCQETPVIIISARSDIHDRVMGLDTGSDDYLTKPFDLSELEARIRALFRRSSHKNHAIFEYGDISLDPGGHKVLKNNQPISVSPKEFALLQKLLQNRGRILTREQLAESLYGWDHGVDSNSLEVHVHNLRKKLGNQLIRTIRGVGYILEDAA